MRIDILTLFPGLIEPFTKESIIKRAIENGKVEINIINIRDFTLLKNGQVDDTPYGGGAGMVLMCEPVFRAVESVKTEESKVILMTPAGHTFNQKTAYDLSKEKHLIFICGHYEGFDERIRTLVDMELSIGDYVLTGGELPACVISDSIIRLIDGVITKESLENESFTDNLLDFPVYTKPREFRGMKVPDVLVSGDHAKINEYREQMRIEKTREFRKDLMGGE